MLLNRTHPLGRGAAAGLLAMSTFGLVACSEDTAGSEEGVSVEDVQEGGEDGGASAYDGAYDSDFETDVTSYEGETVTVSAEIDEILGDQAFTIAGTEDTDVEPLVVIHKDAMENLEAGTVVEVTGVVHKALDVPKVEDAIETDMDDVVLEDFEAEPYIEATNIDSSVESS
ncbi:MAG TPA: hypothetical protein VFQ19_09735 [Nocardioidaceae bacterium]|jgi:hypothetical protein|nr:hypothetical protein [Nocardioidaceae bacterium]